MVLCWIPIKEELPGEGEVNLIVLYSDGLISTNVFYMAEDAAHDHSPWQNGTHWLRKKDLLLIPLRDKK